MSAPMDLKEVKKVIDCSIYNPTMRKDAKDFVDGLTAQIQNLRTSDSQAVDEFNAGYEAYKAGLDLDDAEQMYRHLNEDKPSYDQFSIGYAWAKFQAEKATK